MKKLILFKYIDKEKKPVIQTFYKSARRDSNPRPRPWQGRAPPTEPLAHFFVALPATSNIILESARRDSNPRPRPWQGRAPPTEPLAHFFVALPATSNIILESARRDSNPRPRPWQGRAPPTEPLAHFLSLFLNDRTYNT